MHNNNISNISFKRSYRFKFLKIKYSIPLFFDNRFVDVIPSNLCNL